MIVTMKAPSLWLVLSYIDVLGTSGPWKDGSDRIEASPAQHSPRRASTWIGWSRMCFSLVPRPLHLQHPKTFRRRFPRDMKYPYSLSFQYHRDGLDCSERTWGVSHLTILLASKARKAPGKIPPAPCSRFSFQLRSRPPQRPCLAVHSPLL